MTGGSLKTTTQADKESIQAGWFGKEELKHVNLRAGDIRPLIDVGRRWAGGRRYGGQPVQVGHVSSYFRLVLVARDNSRLLVMVRANGKGWSTCFPVVDVDSYSRIGKELEVRKKLSMFNRK